MNIEALKKQLILDEGCKLEIYLDSLGKPTFGIGHLLTSQDVEWFAWKNLCKEKPGMKISQERVDEIFQKDVICCIKNCEQLFDDFDKLPEEVQQILANMTFNLGIAGLKKFTKFIAAIKDKNFKKASLEMEKSAWYNQVGSRAKRLVSKMNEIANDKLCHV